jgi:hypothetical protein
MAEKSCPPNHSSPPRGSKIALLPLQLSHVKPDWTASNHDTCTARKHKYVFISIERKF